MNSTLIKRSFLDRDAIRHALEVAARTFKEDVAALEEEKQKAILSAAIITASGIEGMLDLFKFYQQRIGQLLEQIYSCDAIVAEMEGDDEREHSRQGAMNDTNGNSVAAVSSASDRFDRKIGSLTGLPNVLHSAPTTVRDTTPIVGNAATFIVQTFRHEEGETIFLEHVDEKGTVRLVIPPKVSRLILRQHEALTSRARKRGAKQGVETRAKLGIKPAFFNKKGASK